MGKHQAGILPTRQPEFQGLKHMTPIGARVAMIAVMKQNNITCRGASDTAADFFPRLRFPVPRGQRPHHYLSKSSLSYGGSELGTMGQVAQKDLAVGCQRTGSIEGGALPIAARRHRCQLYTRMLSYRWQVCQGPFAENSVYVEWEASFRER